MMGVRASGLSLLLSCHLCGCTAAPPEKKLLTAEEVMALTKPVSDCEWHAASRYDDDKSPISSVAKTVQAICTPEIIKTRLAFHVPINDPDLDLAEYKLIVEHLERQRKSRER
jgi:hypothetical protein